MALDISGIYFFMPVFSFLFVFLIVYALLANTKLLGSSNFINLLISFIMAVIFMSFSSLDLYVKTIVPWFIVLLVCIFLVLLLAGMSTKDLGKIMTTKFAWFMIGILIIMFLIAAIKVFNPIFHPDLIITSGEGTSLIEQIKGYSGGYIFGSLLLVVIAIAVSWILTRK